MDINQNKFDYCACDNNTEIIDENYENFLGIFGKKAKAKRAAKKAGVDIKATRQAYKQKYGKGWRKIWNSDLKAGKVTGTLEPTEELDLTAPEGEAGALGEEQESGTNKVVLWSVIGGAVLLIGAITTIVIVKNKKK